MNDREAGEQDLLIQDELLETFFGMSSDEVPNFETLMSLGVELTKGDNPRFLKATDDPVPFRKLAAIVGRLATNAGWDCKFFEMAIIEDAKRVQREPYFLSIVCCRERDDDGRILAAYHEAIRFMKSPEAHGDQIVPSANTYTKGLIWARPVCFAEQRSTDA